MNQCCNRYVRMYRDTHLHSQVMSFMNWNDDGIFVAYTYIQKTHSETFFFHFIFKIKHVSMHIFLLRKKKRIKINKHIVFDVSSRLMMMLSPCPIMHIVILCNFSIFLYLFHIFFTKFVNVRECHESWFEFKWWLMNLYESKSKKKKKWNLFGMFYKAVQ